MNENHQKNEKLTPTVKNDLSILVDKKICFFHDIIQKTIIHVQKNKTVDILGIGEVKNCIQQLKLISEKMTKLLENVTNLSSEFAIGELQTINNDISAVFKTYGTESLEDLIMVCFGNNQSFQILEQRDKYEILKKYFHPTGYKIAFSKPTTDMDTKKTTKFVHMEELINVQMKKLDCFDVYTNVKSFHMKVYGMKIYLQDEIGKKNLFVYGIVDDVLLKILNNSYISNISKSILDNLPADIVANKELFDVFYEFFHSLSLKDYFIHSSNDIYQKFFGMVNQYKLMKQKSLNVIVKEFIQSDLYCKRSTLIYLLIHSNHIENKYIAYLLYDLLSNDANGMIDTLEQTILFDSFPWSIKDLFRDAMKGTIEYTSELSNADINKIPLEQQICLMKAPETVKEKAMMKLKEIKAKNDDSGSKARQYLDGLLKIPFQIYKREKIMYVMDEIKVIFQKVINELPYTNNSTEFVKKEKYTGAEIMKLCYSPSFLSWVSNGKEIKDGTWTQLVETVKVQLEKCSKAELFALIKKINQYIQECSLFPGEKSVKKKQQKIKTSQKTRIELIHSILDICQSFFSSQILNNSSVDSTIKSLFSILGANHALTKIDTMVRPEIQEIYQRFDEITEYIVDVKKTLDGAIHGHENAKKQIERVFGQWISGEQEGYCFGFEGPPGVGKTSLAKRGLANCLKDENGQPRPFAMIQMGGDSNGSTLHGHNYTYVGSTWGGIVQILMDKKCMNPIIFIDELDKISRTEHGREIVGILTHLLDSTQNDSFQDKYFSGIDLDLSKALFILSYNDVESIDKILLDRVHRIKFSSLSLEDKLEITNTHMLPEIYKKIGMEGLIHFSPEVLTTVIEEYTLEPGVRKLREILFEIVGEINLDILKNKNQKYTFPISITLSDIKTKYFKEKQEVRIKKIHEENVVGTINGLWANSIGKGGIIPIQARFYPYETFLHLKLTGMQGDVMKESMNVALTLAWNLTSAERKKQIQEMYNEPATSKYGIHIHCPEGAVPKDGPSAGAAITTVIYSILNHRRIKHNFAITGEIALDGKITEIGGLDIKILGGIKAGVKEFIYPLENSKDWEQFMEKYRNSEIVQGIQFHPVTEISEVLELILEKN